MDHTVLRRRLERVRMQQTQARDLEAVDIVPDRSDVRRRARLEADTVLQRIAIDGAGSVGPRCGVGGRVTLALLLTF